MRFAILSTLFAVFVTSTMAVAPLKSVIISYPNETPQEVVEKAMESIKDAVRTSPSLPLDFEDRVCWLAVTILTVRQGGEITHIYNIIKGFACLAPATILETVQTMDAEHKITIEEDQIVKTQDKGMGGMGF
jgi:hypothetical protein